RQSPASVAEMAPKQAAILDAAATLVKPGGRLVYATCSLLKEENEDITRAFEAKHPEFVPVSASEALQAHGIEAMEGNSLRLWPHIHGTDGFFGTIFERRSL
ncbi:MAG TPA: SAM-dependent methyltransferase, partial [Burkholderiales bacterium]|nr:SAM-dependent methyltransferase [Burkholderiales bacterium]